MVIINAAPGKGDAGWSLVVWSDTILPLKVIGIGGLGGAIETVDALSYNFV